MIRYAAALFLSLCLAPAVQAADRALLIGIGAYASLPEKLFLELPLALAVTKGQGADLIAKLDRGIAAIRADGTWQRIDRRWSGE